jgi:DNA-binding NarL/FixJ family response regulator
VIKVLLADDQPLVRTGFRMILESESDIEVVGEAGDGDDAVRQAGRLRPDVVVMDIQMPITDGIAATAQIAAAGHGRVLILTTFHLDENVVDALRNGASGFLLKDVDAVRLIEAIRVVHAGDAIVDPWSPEGCATGASTGCRRRPRTRRRMAPPASAWPG